ncbi:PREDICTED: tetratricopeptide repeat protein 19 homolog, mitochondrial isoform X2 [Dinoponera quadriceps]|nr:PREDICTED: tetratricopeptide repeat protein 19 homolog, mitochondrial isoform X2 [Dinoponera quadriceps]
MLHIALHQAQTVQHYDAITYIYDVLANVAFYTQEYHKAQNLFVIVMQRLMSKGALENDMRIIHISLKVAKVMEALGQLDEAELGYKFCMEHLQSHIETDPENMDALHAQMLTYEWYGQMLISKSQYTEAYNYILRALNMVKKTDASHEDTIDILNNLGYICYIQEKYDEAIKYYSAAVEIGEKVPDIPHMDIIHVNIGNIFLKKGLYKEAKNSCQQGRKIADNIKNNDVMQEADECLKEVKRLLSL